MSLTGRDGSTPFSRIENSWKSKLLWPGNFPNSCQAVLRDRPNWPISAYLGPRQAWTRLEALCFCSRKGALRPPHPCKMRDEESARLAPAGLTPKSRTERTGSDGQRTAKLRNGVALCPHWKDRPQVLVRALVLRRQTSPPRNLAEAGTRITQWTDAGRSRGRAAPPDARRAGSAGPRFAHRRGGR